MTLLNFDHVSIFSGSKSLVSDLCFSVKQGEIMALVGESGSGKTITSRSIVNLLPTKLKRTGKIIFEGKDLLKLNEKEMKKIRGREISLIFQEPLLALNPLFTIERQLKEMYTLHGNFEPKKWKVQSEKLLTSVGIDDPIRVLQQFPHELSGGMRQRVMIAMAMSQAPKLLIADEPTSALDQETSQLVIDLLKLMNQKYGTTILFITHDLDVIRNFADRIAVMRHGTLVENSASCDFYDNPKSDYGKILLSAIAQHTVDPLEQTDNILTLSKLSKSFDNMNGNYHVLKEIDLAVGRGSVTSLIGSSGSGKSTLAKCLIGLEQPDEGKIIFDKVTIFSDKEKINLYQQAKKLIEIYSKIQYIFQDPYASLDPKMRIDQLLSITLRKVGVRVKEEQDQILTDWFERCLLDPRDLLKYPSQLSGGKRQRIAIIRAMLQKPRLIICDEITAALDRPTQKTVIELILKLQREEKFTLLMISHDLKLVQSISDKVYYLKNGKILQRENQLL